MVDCFEFKTQVIIMNDYKDNTNNPNAKCIFYLLCEAVVFFFTEHLDIVLLK